MADDLLSVLREDHQELKGLLAELEVLSGGEHLRRMLADQLIVESVRHSVAEECYLYPMCRTRLPGGHALADRAYEEHRQIERILAQLEGGGLPDDHFAMLLTWLITDMRAHMDEEEDELFATLAKYVGRDELLELGVKARSSKALAPSRPGTSSGPLVTMVLHGGFGLAERVREYLCGSGRAYPRACRCPIGPGKRPGR